MKRVFRLATLGALTAVVSCSSTDDSPFSSPGQGEISDATHGGGTPGFAFLPPMVANPHLKGVFEGRVPVTVRIDRLGAGGSTLARYTRTTGFGGEVVRVSDSHYQVNWQTDPFDLDVTATYRVSVLVPTWTGSAINPEGRRLGFADVDVVASGAGLRAIDNTAYVGVVDGRTLPISFRLEQGVVDGDGDDVFDWDDNCPFDANANQADGDHDRVGDACECRDVVCHALDQCHDVGVCGLDSTFNGVCSNPAKPDGAVCSLPNATAACTTGACGIVSCNATFGNCDSEAPNGCETEGLDAACSNGIGGCARDGVMVCGATAYSTVCNAVPGEPQPEACDNVDNDCDGTNNELRSDTDATGIAPISCGVGDCAVTVAGCYENAVPMCTPLAPTPEVCDGRDNDCDGRSDEEIPEQVCGLGVCRRTASGCIDGSVPACVPGTPGTELCGNGLDDDCDGLTDEGFDLNTMHDNCGACGHACVGSERCIGGLCTPNCNGMTPNVCPSGCVNLQTDLANCGACGHACGSNQACVMGACVGIGQLSFRMTWNRAGDMDLHVVPPCGTEIYYARSSACGGQLDHDDTVNTGPENIFWSSGAASGTYHVCAVPYRISGTTNFTVQVLNGTTVLASRTGVRTTSTGNQVCSPSSPSFVFSYTRP